MSIPFKAPVDLEKNELQNARIQNLASDPANPVEGQVYQNSADHHLRNHDGTSFKTIPHVDNDTPTAEAVGSAASVGTSPNAARADHRHAMPGNASSGVNGFMSGADKTKLDEATSVNTAGKLVQRDASGRAQFADPSADQDAATKASTAAAVSAHDAVTSPHSATSAATASRLVVRDSAGRAQFSDPSAAQDAATKTYVDTADSNHAALTSPHSATSANTGSRLAIRDANGRTQFTDPAAAQDAATKNYVDTQDSAHAGLTAPHSATASPTASRLVLRDAAGRAQFADPSADQDAATKAYVDSVAQGLDVKLSAVVATTGNITLSGTQTIDGIALVANDRVLVKNQTAPAENGIYLVAAGAWTRAADANAWDKLRSAFVFVENGTANADTGWVCTVDAGGTLGTTAVSWAQFSGAGAWSAANDPSVTGQGVYDNTSGTQFRFRGIKAASSKIAVALASKDITIDVSEANLTHNNIGGTLGVAKGGTGATTAAGARANLNTVGRYAADIGNGALTSITVTHNLGSTDVTVQVWEKAGSKREVFCEKQISDANNVILVFAAAPAASSLRVVVLG